MLKLPAVDLDLAVHEQLALWQAAVDTASDYAARVAAARSSWEQHRQSASLRHAQARLTQMCSGGRRCCYCEDSLADEIEHIWPKSLYPEQVFAWRNFIYACHPCNRAKGARFAVYTQVTGQLQSVSRPPKAPASAAPIAGDMVFIDPRQEDPMEFLQLDLQDTFRLECRAQPGTRAHDRAAYTLKHLPLNIDPLCQERRNEYDNYLSRLERYIAAKHNGHPAEQLMRHREGLMRLRHPTVWREMQRQKGAIAVLRERFDDAPEALDWC